MAYIDFAAEDTLLARAATPLGDAPRHDVTPLVTKAVADKGLSALEWSVVALAQRDRLSSLAKPGRLSVALGTVFGARRPNPRLADPRLEALRRMAVLSWHRGFSIPSHELRAFHAAGFTTAQYETLLTSILPARPGPGRFA